MQQPLYEQVTPKMLEYAAETMADEIQHDAERDPDRQIALPIEYYHKDGTIRLLESMISFIRDENGKPIGIQGLSRDITERMEAEADLINGGEKSSLEEKFDQLMDDDIEKELATLKSARTEKPEPTSS